MESATIDVMTDSYRDNMLRMVKELETQGVHRYRSAPPLYRLAWLLGFRVKPPLYQSFAARAATMGVMFGGAFAIMRWMFRSPDEAVTLTEMLFVTITSGALFGLVMSFMQERQNKKLRLPPLDL